MSNQLAYNEWAFPRDTNPSTRGALQVRSTKLELPVSSVLLQRFRNIGMEFKFVGLTAADIGTELSFWFGNSEPAVEAGERICITLEDVQEGEVTYIRSFVNCDYAKMSIKFHNVAALTSAEFRASAVGGGKRNE